MNGPDYAMLPAHMRGGMRRYIERGIRPGDFLMAVLRNDFVRALMLAGRKARQRIFDIAEFLYYEAPIACWGNKDAVEEWIKLGGLEGIRKAETQWVDE